MASYHSEREIVSCKTLRETTTCARCSLVSRARTYSIYIFFFCKFTQKLLQMAIVMLAHVCRPLFPRVSLLHYVAIRWILWLTGVWRANDKFLTAVWTFDMSPWHLNYAIETPDICVADSSWDFTIITPYKDVFIANTVFILLLVLWIV